MINDQYPHKQGCLIDYESTYETYEIKLKENNQIWNKVLKDIGEADYEFLKNCLLEQPTKLLNY